MAKNPIRDILDNLSSRIFIVRKSRIMKWVVSQYMARFKKNQLISRLKALQPGVKIRNQEQQLKLLVIKCLLLPNYSLLQTSLATNQVLHVIRSWTYTQNSITIKGIIKWELLPSPQLIQVSHLAEKSYSYTVQGLIVINNKTTCSQSINSSKSNSTD